MTAPPADLAWLAALSDALDHGTLLKLVLSRPRGTDPATATQIRVRPLTLRGQPVLSFVHRFPTRDETHNLPPAAALDTLRALLNTLYRSAHLFLPTETLQLDYSKKGRPMLRRSAAEPTPAPPTTHDRPKQRLLSPDAPWLHPLGITAPDHTVLPSMSRKWKQLNKFAEILQGPLQALTPGPHPVHILDFGCGRGHLTFALYDQARRIHGPSVRVTGVELRPHLTDQANRIARHLHCDGLTFIPGDIRDTPLPTPLHGIIALHACDTATDLALAAGIRARAHFLLCAPCCHKELRPQISIPPVLQPLLRYGIQLGQEAEMITDTLRTLLLESRGYDTKLFEFISLEHTPKNKMILAVRGRGDPAALQKAQDLKAFYGIQVQALEKELESIPA